MRTPHHAAYQARDLILLWTVATAGLGTLGGVLPGVFLLMRGNFNPAIDFVDDNLVGPLLLWAAGLVFTLGPGLGLGQALVLRWLFDRQISQPWIAATALSAPLALLAGGYLSTLVPGFGWLVIPLVVGLAQCPVLHRRVDGEAGWWIPIVTFAGQIAAFAGRSLSEDLAPQGGFDLPFYPIAGAIHWLAGTAIAMLVFGLLTGGGLVWLIHRHDSIAGTNPPPPTPTA